MKKFALLLGLCIVALLAHMFTQYSLFSLFQVIMSIPLMIVLITPLPAVLAVCTFIILELFSSLPQGSVVCMFLIPYLVLLFWKSLRVDLSWKFFFGVTVIIALQSISLLCILALADMQRLIIISPSIFLLQILVTSIGTFILSFIYHEYAERL